MLNQSRGKLIVFEGGEGVGKTTQLHRLFEWLKHCNTLKQLQSQGHVAGIKLTRQPGGTELGGRLRQLLLTEVLEQPIEDTAELLLYAADRAQHVAEVIRPQLEAGFIVLCDRYTDSTVAYQGYGRGLNLSLIDRLNEIATGGLQSDLTFWLKLDVTAGLARTQRRGAADRIEQNQLDFHQRVQQGFESLAQTDSNRIVAIAADGDEAAIAAEIQQIIQQRLIQWYHPHSTRF
ncbi:MAG: dTMP kinase [Cyanobacteria bacterium J06635_15]